MNLPNINLPELDLISIGLIALGIYALYLGQFTLALVCASALAGALNPKDKGGGTP